MSSKIHFIFFLVALKSFITGSTYLGSPPDRGLKLPLSNICRSLLQSATLCPWFLVEVLQRQEVHVVPCFVHAVDLPRYVIEALEPQDGQIYISVQIA